jgi:hypothetical protein
MSEASSPHISPEEIEKAVDLARGVRRDIESLTPGTTRDEYELYDGRLASAVLGLFEQLEAATNDASHLRLQLADAESDVARLRHERDDVERPAVLDTLAEYREKVAGLEEQLEVEQGAAKIALAEAARQINELVAALRATSNALDYDDRHPVAREANEQARALLASYPAKEPS